MNPTDSPRRRRPQGPPPSPPRGRGAGAEGRPVVGGGADLPRWADALLTLWVAVVALVYFGGYFWPDTVGVYTAAGRTVYAALLLVAAVNLTLRYLNRGKNADGADDTRGHAHED